MGCDFDGQSSCCLQQQTKAKRALRMVSVTMLEHIYKGGDGQVLRREVEALVVRRCEEED